MKKHTTTILFILLGVAVQAQSIDVEYTYDAAGNRTIRAVIMSLLQYINIFAIFIYIFLLVLSEYYCYLLRCILEKHRIGVELGTHREVFMIIALIRKLKTIDHPDIYRFRKIRNRSWIIIIVMVLGFLLLKYLNAEYGK